MLLKQQLLTPVGKFACNINDSKRAIEAGSLSSENGWVTVVTCPPLSCSRIYVIMHIKYIYKIQLP